MNIHPDDDTHLATPAEADREWATNVGREYPERAWILSDRDVWYQNPAYRGPAVPHPEDDGAAEIAIEIENLRRDRNDRIASAGRYWQEDEQTVREITLIDAAIARLATPSTPVPTDDVPF